MRIILITQGVSPIVKPFIDSHHDIVGIIESALRKRPNSIQKIISLIIIGIGRGLGKKNYTLKEFAKQFEGSQK